MTYLKSKWELNLKYLGNIENSNLICKKNKNKNKNKIFL